MTTSKIQTEIGSIEIGATDKHHIWVRAEGVTINRVQYHINAHFYLWNTGKWYLGRQTKADGTSTSEYERKIELYISRRDHKDWSFAAKDKAEKVLFEAVNQWAEKNPLAILAAELDNTNKQVDNLTKDVETLEAELKLKRQGLENLTKYRNVIEAAVTQAQSETENAHK